MKLFISLLFITFSLILVESKYEIILDRQEAPLGDADMVWKPNWTARIKKYNRSASVLFGQFATKIAVDDSFKVEFEAFNLSGGQYKKLFGREIGGVCEVAWSKNAEKDARYFMEHATTTPNVTYGMCPIPAVTVDVIDWSPESLGDYIPPYIPGNERWRLTVWVKKEGERVAGMTYYAILRDNQKLIEGKWRK